MTTLQILINFNERRLRSLKVKSDHSIYFSVYN